MCRSRQTDHFQHARSITTEVVLDLAHDRCYWDCDNENLVIIAGNPVGDLLFSLWTRTHGGTLNRTITPEYSSWRAMRSRCLNLKDKSYAYYGGRGITICDRWKDSFAAFLEDMGLKPSKLHTIERINVDGNYEPTNCKWATRLEQTHNRRARSA